MTTADPGEADGPAQSQQTTCESAQRPRFDDEQNAGKSQSYGEPTAAPQLLSQEWPGKQQDPELPGVGQEERTTGRARHQSRCGGPHETGHLQHPKEHGEPEGPGFEGTLQQKDNPKKHDCPRHGPQCREHEGCAVAHRYLGGYPRVAPQDGQHAECNTQRVAICLHDQTLML